ncbi:MAG: hypothetical protein IJK66_00610 [Bacilli bacterium]|nr:hypothetical protein [Bacilli bacterium]
MSVFKIEKNKDYTIMSNYHLRDKNLSYKAKGLLSFMLSLPEDWDYSLNGLVSLSKEGIKAVRNILQELKDLGYLVIEKKQNEIGQFEYNYLIYEIPHSPKGDMDKADMGKDIQINTNIQNTKDKEDIIDKQSSCFFIPEKHNALTLSLINNKYIQEYDLKRFQYDDLFNDYLNNGITYKELAIIVNYVCSKAIKNNFKDEYGNKIINKYSYLKSAIDNNLNKSNLDIESLWDDDYLLNLLDEIINDEFEKNL